MDVVDDDDGFLQDLSFEPLGSSNQDASLPAFSPAISSLLCLFPFQVLFRKGESEGLEVKNGLLSLCMAAFYCQPKAAHFSNLTAKKKKKKVNYKGACV